MASLFAPLYYLFGDGIAWPAQAMIFAALATLSGLVILRHRDNIARLFAGTESKIGATKPPG